MLLWGGVLMGRPPHCSNCCGGGGGGTTNFSGCPFFDNFAAQNLSYGTYSSPAGAVFTETGGKVTQTGTTLGGNGAFYQSLTAPTNTSLLRSIQTLVTVNAETAPLFFGTSGLFIGQLAACVIDTVHGTAQLATCDNFGNALGTFPDTFPVSGNTRVQIAAQEYGVQGQWFVQLVLNGNLVLEVILNQAVTNPLNVGLHCSGGGPAGTNNFSWSSGLQIGCLDSSLGFNCFANWPPVWTAIASAWKVPAVPGLTSTSTSPCSPCGLYNQLFTLVYSPSSGLCSFFDASRTLIQCPPRGGTVMWGLVMVNSPPSPLRMLLIPAGGPFYEKTVATFNPLGPNTMTLNTFSHAGCSGWPATITITPGP